MEPFKAALSQGRSRASGSTDCAWQGGVDRRRKGTSSVQGLSPGSLPCVMDPPACFWTLTALEWGVAGGLTVALMQVHTDADLMSLHFGVGLSDPVSSPEKQG